MILTDPFEEDVLIDCFIVMNKGINALRLIERSPCHGNDRLLERMKLYKYRHPEKAFHPLYHANEFGGLEEEEFTIEGVPVIMDDVISSGRTLGLAAQYVHSLGYPYGNVFVYAQRYFPPSSGEDGLGGMLPYSVFSLKQISGVLEGILPLEFSCTTSP